jgi:hypothetical protein
MANPLVDTVLSLIKRPLKITTQTALSSVLVASGFGSVAVPLVNSLVDVAIDALED